MGYGVMVTLQILVLSFLVRVRVSQLRASFFLERCFFVLYDLAILDYIGIHSMFFLIFLSFKRKKPKCNLCTSAF